MLAGGVTQGSGIVTGPEGLPWPAGDPDQLRTTAQHAAGLAEETERKRASLLDSGRDVNPWSGMAHQTYVANLERHATGADKMASGLRESSSGLMSLAGTMQQAQELIRRLAERLGDAREQARRAAQRAEHARAEAEAARQRAMATAPVSGGTDPAAQEAQAAEESAQQAEAEAARAQQHAQDVERQCQAQAEQACDDVRRQDSQSSASIDQAQEAWWEIEQTLLSGLSIGGAFILGKMEGWAGGIKYLVKKGQLPESWLTKAKWAGRGLKVGGGVLAGTTSALGQWFKDQRRHPNMDTDERVGRSAFQGVTVGGSSFLAGMAAGAAVGSVVPVAGTVVGGVVGAAVGIGAGLLVDHFNDGAMRWVGDQFDKIDDAAGAAKDWIGDTAGSVKEAGAKVADKLTFWN